MEESEWWNFFDSNIKYWVYCLRSPKIVMLIPVVSNKFTLILFLNPKSMSYRQIFYQIVFGTKYREPTIAEAHCELLYKYIWGVIKNNKSGYIALMVQKIIFIFFPTCIRLYPRPIM